jgi:hypothetical protein
MFYHVKQLQFNARVSRPDPAFATLLLEQLGGAKDSFNLDLHEVRNLGITRLPIQISRWECEPSMITSGFKPYEALIGIVEKIAPDLTILTSQKHDHS